MSRVTWELRTICTSLYTGTVIFAQNEGDQNWTFIRNSCSTVMYAKLVGSQTQRTEISPYGIGGFGVLAEDLHGLVKIAVSVDNDGWNRTSHDYHGGRTTAIDK